APADAEVAAGTDPTEDSRCISVSIPDPFWPTALGLPQPREIEFLRALTLNDPILCILHEPEDAQTAGWLQGTWEGLLSWAYRSAQRFLWRSDFRLDSRQTQIGTVDQIHNYLRPTVLDQEAPGLHDAPGS